MNTLVPLVSKECLEDLVATRGVVFLVIASVVLSAFSILLISNTELSLLENAQAVYMMSGIIIAIASLVAVIRGSDGFAGERERETLGPLMLTPITGHMLGLAKLGGIIFSWLVLFLLSLPYLWAAGSTGQNLLPAIEYVFITGMLVVLSFGGIALALSVKMRSFKSALSVSLTILLLAGSPLVLGPALRQSTIGRAIDLLNPLAGALNTLDSVIIDSQGLVFQLHRLSIMLGYAFLILVILHGITRQVEI